MLSAVRKVNVPVSVVTGQCGVDSDRGWKVEGQVAGWRGPGAGHSGGTHTLLSSVYPALASLPAASRTARKQQWCGIPNDGERERGKEGTGEPHTL